MRTKQSTFKPMSSQEWLQFHFKNWPITQRELAAELGFKSHNSVNLWIKGRQAMPLKHAISLAKKFGVDPLFIRNIVLYEMYPDLDIWEWDERIRNLQKISLNELEFLEILRATGRNPKMNDEQKEKFKQFVESLATDGE